MKKLGKRLLGIGCLYLCTVGLTLLLSDRVETLESKEDLRNQNQSVVLHLH